MQEQKQNAKCPYCGAELYIGYETGTGFCTSCKRQFDNAKAIKLYSSLYEEKNEVEEEKNSISGEDYLEVDRILTRTEFHLEKNDFESAKAELEKALKLSTNDFRIYFGFVRVETKNLTDYRNTTHEPYLKKAIECADTEDKAVIMRLYKDFYQLSKCSDEDILQYKTEENVAIKNKLEEKFKDLIPIYMKKARGLKLSLILGIILSVISLTGLVVGAIFDISWLLAGATVLLFCCYVVFRGFFITRKLDKLFNALLDFYDQVDNFEFSVASKREVLDAMKICRKEFGENNNLTGCENSLASLVKIVENSSSKAKAFIESHAVLNEFLNVYEE